MSFADAIKTFAVINRELPQIIPQQIVNKLSDYKTTGKENRDAWRNEWIFKLWNYRQKHQGAWINFLDYETADKEHQGCLNECSNFQIIKLERKNFKVAWKPLVSLYVILGNFVIGHTAPQLWVVWWLVKSYSWRSRAILGRYFRHRSEIGMDDVARQRMQSKVQFRKSTFFILLRK